jgi:hypothetical protein
MEELQWEVNARDGHKIVWIGMIGRQIVAENCDDCGSRSVGPSNPLFMNYYRAILKGSPQRRSWLSRRKGPYREIGHCRTFHCRPGQYLVESR